MLIQENLLNFSIKSEPGIFQTKLAPRFSFLVQGTETVPVAVPRDTGILSSSSQWKGCLSRRSGTVTFLIISTVTCCSDLVPGKGAWEVGAPSSCGLEYHWDTNVLRLGLWGSGTKWGKTRSKSGDPIWVSSQLLNWEEGGYLLRNWPLSLTLEQKCTQRFCPERKAEQSLEWLPKEIDFIFNSMEKSMLNQGRRGERQWTAAWWVSWRCSKTID